MTADRVESLLAEGIRSLAGGPAAAGATGLDAQLLLAAARAVPRAQLHSHPEARVTTAQAAGYRHLLARRAAGEPLAYLTGRREFWSLELAVTPAVLIPRPETELLVERALALGPAEARAADLGTGSGAVALALARERPRWRLLATDVSAPALAVARANAAALGAGNVEFRHGSWFEPLAGERFELLLSNPPYVAADDA
jgi:release factor glutamine methyltransferase